MEGTAALIRWKSGRPTKREWGKWRVKYDTWKKQEIITVETPDAGGIFPY